MAPAAKKPTTKSTKSPNSALLPITGPFTQEGPLEWALLVQLSPPELTSRAFRLMNRHVIRSMWDFEAERTWHVVPGTEKHSALIETAPGSSTTEIDIARALSKDSSTPVYALGFTGYVDPDHGLPFITRYDAGKSGLIWMSSDGEDDELPTVAGPKGIPCDDPFEFAEALGCKLRPYFARR